MRTPSKSNLNSKPFSIRFSYQTSMMIDDISQSQGVSASDFIRIAVEQRIHSMGHYIQDLTDAMANPVDTINQIRVKLLKSECPEKVELTLVECGALILFCHDGYASARGEHVSGEQFGQVLNLTHKLIAAAEADGVNINIDFFKSRLGIHPDDDIYAGIDALKQKNRYFAKRLVAESAIRPLVILARRLDEFSPMTVNRILSKDVARNLMPLALLGLRKQNSNILDISSPSNASKIFHFETGGEDNIEFSVSATGNPLMLSISTQYHNMSLQSHAVAALFMIAKQGKAALEDVVRQDGHLSKDGLEIVINQDLVSLSDVSESSHGKTFMPRHKFDALMQALVGELDDQSTGWAATIESFRQSYGES